jgi:hypothetical protein
MSPPTGGGPASGVGVDDQRFLTRSLSVEALEQLDCRKLPGGGRGQLRGHYREIDATSRASAARSTWSAPEVVDHLGDRVPGLRVCYLVEYAGSSPAQDSQLP